MTLAQARGGCMNDFVVIALMMVAFCCGLSFGCNAGKRIVAEKTCSRITNRIDYTECLEEFSK